MLSVPVYDGCSGFHLSKYWKKLYTGEVPKGSTMMLLFSVKKGKLGEAVQKAPNLPVGVKFAIYLNILAVIVLAEPVEEFSDRPSREPPQAFGVDNIVKLHVSKESDMDDVVENVKSDATDPDDPIL